MFTNGAGIGKQTTIHGHKPIRRDRRKGGIKFYAAVAGEIEKQISPFTVGALGNQQVVESTVVYDCVKPNFSVH